VAVVLIVLIAIGLISYSTDTGPTAEYIPTTADTVIPIQEVAEATPRPTQPPLTTEVLTGAEIFAKNRDAVFIIRTAGAGYMGTGSGFFICYTGIAVTNHHVMMDWPNATAILYDDREFPITGYFFYDIGNDLAVIQVDGGGVIFDYVVKGDSDAVNVGENVFAIGGPDWDPITFTHGMISRIAYEPINFDSYSIAGMLQSTAAIYGGNSGGPLVNDRGHVIGVNAAGNIVRASVQFAVPINRVVMPEAGAVVNPLPMGGTPTTHVREAGLVFMYTRFPFIPDFLSVSEMASLHLSSTPAGLGLSPGDILYDLYDYLYMYDLASHLWIPDTDMYDIILQEHGFVMQNIVAHGEDVWVYFFHPYQNISLSYAYMPSTETLLVAVVSGDVYTLFYHSGAEGGQAQMPADPEWDLTVAGVWVFFETTDAFYRGLMNNDDVVLYIFEPDGTGYWGAVDELENITHELYLYWATENGTIIIEFPEIDLVLVYEYTVFYDDIVGHSMRFVGDGEHHLLFVED